MKTKLGKKSLVTQYREIFPAGYWPQFFGHEDLAQSEGYVISQNFTTYSVGETPIPLTVPKLRDA
jgi:hypothetical protein